MYTNDPISDMLTRIRNALMTRHNDVLIPYSKMKYEIARVLYEEGYITSYERIEDRPYDHIRLVLKYTGSRRDVKPVITRLQRISKPGRRVYSGYRDIPWVLSGMGIAILTTPKGVMTDQQARRERVGGEILCYVW
ncbi:MAG: 30S ribosomal protein S8 [Chloroflexi bacterium]|nr:30S ribosomal protein S8 [Chloroflexota bacterium]